MKGLTPAIIIILTTLLLCFGLTFANTSTALSNPTTPQSNPDLTYPTPHYGTGTERKLTEISENLAETANCLNCQDKHINSHRLVFWLCLGISAIAGVILCYLLFVYRRSKAGINSRFHKSFLVEMLWTLVPLIILILMIIPAAREFFQ